MELVVLVDEQNTQIGTAKKATVHTADTPLHRGFSLFLFNSKGQILLTKRAQGKTFSDLWTNTVCGHPGPDESSIDAAKRRLHDEMGISGVDIKEVAPYRYSFTDTNGIMENEICPILTALFENTPNPDPHEVSEWKWMDWNEFLEDIQQNPDMYSPWSKEEAGILNTLESIQVN